MTRTIIKNAGISFIPVIEIIKVTNNGEVPANRLKAKLYEIPIPLYRMVVGKSSIKSEGMDPIIEARSGADRKRPIITNMSSWLDIN